MSEQNPLPSEDERVKLCEILSHALIEIRLLAGSGKAGQVADLADVWHSLPREMYGWGLFDWSLLRGMAAQYQAKYHDRYYDYVAMLDQIRPPD